MFPRKQYIHRQSNGHAYAYGPGEDPIVGHASNMPIGSFSYPYKTSEDPSHVDNANSFAIYNGNDFGWRFFQLENIDEPSISKVWKFTPIQKEDNWYADNIAYHLGDTVCGDVFMQRSEDEDNLNVNVLPFEYAMSYFRNASETEDARKYILCDTTERTSDRSSSDWRYLIKLIPDVATYASILYSTIDRFAPHYGIDSEYTEEQANRKYVGSTIFNEGRGVCDLHTSWGELVDTDNGTDQFRYNIVDVTSPLKGSGVMLAATENSTYILRKPGDSWRKYLAILEHVENPDGSSKDYVLRTARRGASRFLFSLNKSADGEESIALGDFIRHDDVLVFVFDSCSDDDARASIRSTLLARSGAQLSQTDLVCYKPKLESAPKSLTTAIIEHCKKK